MAFLRRLYHFFPVQLLVLHVKNHQVLLLIWVFLFLIITNNWGKSYGIPFLFLDPEYLGQVDFLSFSILGAAFGGFLMTWNIAVYILDSFRFPFLATFNRPFAIFSLNNSIIPLIFLITYFSITVTFQLQQEFVKTELILLDVSGFLSGFFIIIFISAIYFTTTNKNIFRMFGVKIKPVRVMRKVRMRQKSYLWEKFKTQTDDFPVNYYLTANLKIRHIRGVEHYDEKMILSVLRQNHFNALIIELMTLATLVGLGFLIDYQAFNIPAGASALLLLGVLVSISGVLSFWMKEWKNTLLIVMLVAIDLFYRFGGLAHDSRAFGLNYGTLPAKYSHESLRQLCTPDKMKKDAQNTIQILENWKKRTGQAKPKMILVNVSGGGLSAAMFSTLMLQHIDSSLDGNFFKHTAVMTGSSGGMFGATYMRELYLQKVLEERDSIYKPQHAHNISKDLLNSICFTIVVNDLFYPWQKFQIGDYTYRKDRGYAMERQLNINTNYTLKKNLGSYAEYEKNAIVPLLIFAPTIINDERKLFISTQPMTYMMRPEMKEFTPDYSDIDGVDFQALFASHDANNLQVTTAIRMNSTYPYILPNVTMPTDPIIKVMDAGFRDNYGVETSVRFVRTFNEWIKENTSGVVMVQIRNFRRERPISEYHRESMIDRFVNPITNLYQNWGNIQDYNHDYLISFADEWLDGNLDAIYFEYIPSEKDEETSMSLHLTSREKFNIMETVKYPHIQRNMEELQRIMGTVKSPKPDKQTVASE